MKRYFFVVLVCAFLSAQQNLYASAVVKLADYIVSATGLSEMLAHHGFSGVDAKQVESYVASSLSSFGNGKSLTKQQFSDVLAKLPVTGQDATIRKELQLLLDKPQSQITKAEFVNVVNNIIYLANRHGKSIIITCAECVSDGLSKSGFKFTVENIKNSSSLKLLQDIVPNNPKDLQVFISARVKRLNLGDYSKVTPQMVNPYEEKTLALFLALYENGSAEYKDLTRAIVKLSNKSGKTNLFDISNPNKLWKVVSNDYSSAEISKLTEALNEMDSIARSEKLKVEESFNKVMRNKAEKSDELLSKYKAIKSKRCFFK